MGIGLAIVSWCFKGTIIATLLAVLAGTLTAICIPRGRARRTRHILWACVYPFAVLSWFLAVFVFQAYVNESVLYRDAGIGHTWQTPLPNGYAVLLLDERHDGTVFDPNTHFANTSNNEIHPNGPDAVSGVRVVQIAGNKILGGAGPIGQYSSPASRNRIDSYFLLDTGSHTRTDFANYDALTQTAQALGIQPNLEPLYRVYKNYRYTWFDLTALALFLIPVTGVGLLLARRIWRLRQLRHPTEIPAEDRKLRHAS
ncbi:MAG TPA: hypothetical protein VGJ06_06095 [Candidatus Acidoferrum sp.]|jgi:hypothetical protein